MFLCSIQNLNSDSTLPHLPIGFVLIAFFVKYQWAPLKSAKGIVDEHTHAHKTYTPADFRPVDTSKLLLFKKSARVEHKPFVSEEHKAEIRVRNNFYSVKKPSMAGMIGMLKDTLKFHHSTQKELFIQRILWKATQSRLSGLKKTRQTTTYVAFPSLRKIHDKENCSVADTTFLDKGLNFNLTSVCVGMGLAYCFMLMLLVASAFLRPEGDSWKQKKNKANVKGAVTLKPACAQNKKCTYWICRGVLGFGFFSKNNCGPVELQKSIS